MAFQRGSLFAMVIACLFLRSAYAGAEPCPKAEEAPQAETGAAALLVPHGQGVLWKVDRPGLESSYIFGTLHVDIPPVTTLPQPVQNALFHSKSLTLEVVMHPAARAAYAEMTVIPNGGTLRAHLDAALLARLTKLAQEEYGMPAEVVERLKPWAAFTLLSRPRPTTGRLMEDVLEDTAIQQRKPVYGLETIAELTSSLDGLSVEDQLSILKDTVCNHHRLPAVTQALIERYLQRDLAGMVALNARAHDDEQVFERFMQRTLYDRNRRMAERIGERLAEEQSFIAVGALHLPGEEGLLRLLEQSGFRVSAVY